MNKNKFDEIYKSKIFVQFKNYMPTFLSRSWLIKNSLKNINNENGLILEIGCGISPITMPSTHNIYVDLSPFAVEFLNNQGAKAFVGDIKKLNFKDNEFDTIICSEVLEHIDDDKRAIKELYRVLKPNGTLLITVPIHKYYWFKDDEIVGHHRRYNPRILANVLAKKNFKDIKITKSGNPFERLTNILFASMFELYPNKKKKENKIFSYVFPLYKYSSMTWALFLYLISVITPMSLASIALVQCKK